MNDNGQIAKGATLTFLTSPYHQEINFMLEYDV